MGHLAHMYRLYFHSPSCCLPLFQIECSCKTFHMKMTWFSWKWMNRWHIFSFDRETIARDAKLGIGLFIHELPQGASDLFSSQPLLGSSRNSGEKRFERDYSILECYLARRLLRSGHLTWKKFLRFQYLTAKKFLHLLNFQKLSVCGRKNKFLRMCIILGMYTVPRIYAINVVFLISFLFSVPCYIYSHIVYVQPTCNTFLQVGFEFLAASAPVTN